MNAFSAPADLRDPRDDAQNRVNAQTGTTVPFGEAIIASGADAAEVPAMAVTLASLALLAATLAALLI